MPNKAKLKRLGQFALPLVALPFANRFANRVVRSFELGSCLIQGKGSGSGWDISSEVSVAARFIKTNTPVLIDAGANLGDWSTGMLKLFPYCSKLLMIEPQPACVETLEEISFPNSVIFRCALADMPGELNFYTAEERDGWDGASLFERFDTVYSGVSQRRALVPARKLDDIIDESGVQTIDFMKMDIEGAELLALKGAEVSLREGKIKALSFEFGCGNINSRTFFRDFWDFLTLRHFSIFRILPGGKTLRISEYHEDLECFYRATNYVASM